MKEKPLANIQSFLVSKMNVPLNELIKLPEPFDVTDQDIENFYKNINTVRTSPDLQQKPMPNDPIDEDYLDKAFEELQQEFEKFLKEDDDDENT